MTSAGYFKYITYAGQIIRMNKDISYALDYHELTKHSEISIMTSRHSLDLGNRPIPFKIYTELPSISLQSEFPIPALKAIPSISNIHPKRPNTKDSGIITTKNNSNSEEINATKTFTLKELSSILFFSAGITREMKYDYGTFYMRAASATGALYPIELYVICKDISPNLKAGVYHFNPADFSLTQIRAGDYRTTLAAVAGDSQDILTSPLTIAFTSYAWRNAWKYQARSYRHWFWDSGVIAANLLATTVSMALPTRLITGFVDDKVSRLLCLEDQREAAVAMAAIGIGLSKITLPKDDKEIPYIPIPKLRPLSKKGEIEYPEIWRLNDASKLFSKEEVKEWINNNNSDPSAVPSNKQSSAVAHTLDRQTILREHYNSSTVA